MPSPKGRSFQVSAWWTNQLENSFQSSGTPPTTTTKSLIFLALRKRKRFGPTSRRIWLRPRWSSLVEPAHKSLLVLPKRDPLRGGLVFGVPTSNPRGHRRGPQCRVKRPLRGRDADGSIGYYPRQAGAGRDSPRPEGSPKT